MPTPNGVPAPKLVIRRIIPATREEVFGAWTDPESLRHWMCPGDILEAEAQLDVRVGGAYRILMKGKDKAYEHTGIYRWSTLPPGWYSPGSRPGPITKRHS